MESVEWIFSDHKLHLSMLQLLREEQALLTKETTNATDRDDEIDGMVLAPPPLDGMPHVHTTGSSTEWVVMKLNSIQQDYQTLFNEIDRYNRLLRLYDAVIHTLTENEKWFVEQYYNQGCSLASLPTLPNSPFQNLTRSTMSNYKKRLLQKTVNFFLQLQTLGRHNK